ncbi:two-partner secretion domain-containing protein [Oscillatoria salina]|uniref:two-partner secretion domain-containing protein n=1 Tax=Oscillatoria salina TaxID=331517 RepID=UPI001CC92193|nr:filamentous hemagglutinin N-terminal domain-containing protein [Oscillatoria salina]MBZ8179065.1 filamentous hemagglutinin N-terminal domain-containing protein [Oscillatoria salina IIICB1]
MLRQKLNFPLLKNKKLIFSLLTLANYTILCYGNLAIAQLIPDRSLGEENSTVTPDNINGIPSDIIDGGATRGTNLFHSFQEFNINQGRGVYFSNPANIENIFNRVTGNNVSNIFGTLGVLGNANLFLINPNGIIFGPNARLDLRGSFFASTADSLVFNNDFEFSASNPEAPPLLTVNMPIGLRFRDNPGTIIVQGTGINRPEFDESLSERENELNFQQALLNNSQGLQVEQGRSLGLIGGEITLTSGLLKAEAGNIELGSVGEGFVSLISTANGFTLGYEEISDFRDIQLLQESGVFASGEGGGDIQIVGRNLLARELSEIQATTLGANSGGDIIIKTSELVEIRSNGQDEELPTTIAAATLGTGNAGDVQIETGQLQIIDDAAVGVISLSEGNAGKIQITADLLAINSNSILTTIALASGEAGDITIETGQLQMADASQIITATQGEGNGGTLEINAQTIVLTDNASLGAGSFALVNSGNGGNVKIQTEQLQMSDLAEILVGTLGSGDAGSLVITAENIEMSGDAGVTAGTFGQGNAGNVTITTQQLQMSDEASIATATLDSGNAGTLSVEAETVTLSGNANLVAATTAEGDGGNISLATRQLLLQDKASITAATEGVGNGGTLEILATDLIELTGSSGLSTATEGQGTAGNVNIETNELILGDRASLTVGTIAEGNGGTLDIQASQLVQLTDSSSILTGTFGDGNAGNAKIATERFLLQDDAFIVIGSFGNGNGGTLAVNASEDLILSGSSYIVAGTQGLGTGGNLNIETENFLAEDQASIGIATMGIGNAGTLEILADVVEMRGESSLGAGTSGAGDAGDVRIRGDRVFLSDGALIQAITSQTPPETANENLESGMLEEAIDNAIATNSLDIEAQALALVENSTNAEGEIVVINGAGRLQLSVPNILASSSQTEPTLTNNEIEATTDFGNAGNVIIQTDLLTLQDQASILAETRSNGTGGSISITQAETVDLNEGGKINAGAFATGDAGNVTIDTRQLLLRNGARVEVSTESNGKGGNIQVRAADLVELIGTSADEQTYTGLVAATSSTGDAGRVSIETRRLVIRDGAAVGASVDTIVDEAIPGDVFPVEGGTVNVIASESVEILGTSANGVYPSSLTVTTEDIGDAGSIFVSTPRLIIGDRAQITATTSGIGAAGDIRLETESLSLFEEALIVGATFASGDAGDVNIQTEVLTVRSNSQISVIGQGTGNPGSINVTATDSLLLDEGAFLAASELGKGGNITVSSPDIRLRNGSTISAIGGSAGNVSLEGNITINTETLVLLEASSIITDAVATQGGSNIVISPLNGDDLFVFQSPDSTINASGDLQIDTDLDDESFEIVQSQEVDPNQEVATNACQQGEGSEFVVTGRGGLPTNPNQVLEAENITTGFIDPVAPSRATIVEEEENVSVSSPTRKTPARGWVVNDKGEVVLVAYDPTTTPIQRHLVNPALCQE